MSITRISRVARTLWKLGPLNVVRVGIYKLLLKSGVYRRLLPIAAPVRGPFFNWSTRTAGFDGFAAASPQAWLQDARRVMAGQLPAFSNHWVEIGFPPRWHRSMITQVDHEGAGRHWSEISDFSGKGGDIKGYWEASRFDGLLMLTLGWISSPQDDLRDSIETWIADWCERNPANEGPQWKCGQETSLRLMHLLLVVELLRRWSGVEPTHSLQQVVAEHANRIAATMLYAIGQDNNHGTSEAAALFVAGAFLKRSPRQALSARGTRWMASGRHWLENRLSRLVAQDGSFSQHSVNYHRMMLDTCALAETFRRWYEEPSWSPPMTAACARATLWLAAFIDAEGGDAPNLGANDGSRLFVMHRLPYRDYRPSAQWAAHLFLGQRLFTTEAIDEQLTWLGQAHSATADTVDSRAARVFPDGGYATLTSGSAWLLLRLPVFRFRPSQADALHLDLWLGDQCVLHDAGSFSYNTSPQWLAYFSGTASHNTIQFDDHDQMPRLSRFLFGEWLNCEALEADVAQGRVSAAYRDVWGARHHRSVVVGPGRCTVTDSVSGFARRAVLRWRLFGDAEHWAGAEGDWHNGQLKLHVSSTTPLVRAELTTGWQSLHYAEKTSVPMFEAEVPSDAVITTEISWAE